MTPTLTLTEYAARWLATLRGTVREHTRRKYRWVLDRYLLPTLGAVPLAQLTRHAVRDCLAALLARDLAPRSALAAHAVLHALLNTALDDELVLANVARGLGRKLNRAVRPRMTLGLPQLDLFLAEAATQPAPDTYPLAVALAGGGLRIGEALGLRDADVDDAAPLVTVRRTVRMGGCVGPPKSGRARVVRLTEAAARVLRGRRGRGGWLFPGRLPAKPIGYTYAASLIRATATAAGLVDVTPKTLRRSYASAMRTEGAALGWISQQLGHVAETTTERYYVDGAEAPIPDFLRRG